MTQTLTADLTPRERQTLILLANGKDCRSISAELGVSESTVRTHLHHAYKKLGARGAAQAVAIFSRGRRPALPAPVQPTERCLVNAVKVFRAAPTVARARYISAIADAIADDLIGF